MEIFKRIKKPIEQLKKSMKNALDKVVLFLEEKEVKIDKIRIRQTIIAVKQRYSDLQKIRENY